MATETRLRTGLTPFGALAAKTSSRTSDANQGGLLAADPTADIESGGLHPKP